jgi:hypothetical protein
MLHGEKYIITKAYEEYYNYDYEIMAILDGEEHATKSLMNIERTSFTTSGKDFNYLFSPKQIYYVEMQRSHVPIEEGLHEIDELAS